MRRTAATAVVVLTLGFSLAGCTPDEPDEVSTAGVLTAEDLGAGNWDGPFARLQDSDATARGVSCGPLGFTWGTPGGDLTVSRSVVWVNGDLAVRTFADRYEDGSSGVEDRMADFELAESCVRPEGAPSPGKNPILSFTFEDVDGTVQTRESYRRGARRRPRTGQVLGREAAGRAVESAMAIARGEGATVSATFSSTASHPRR